MNTPDVAWAAGFYEGEGTVGVSLRKAPSGKRYSSLAVSLPQVNREPLERLCTLFGGNITWRARKISTWQIGGAPAEQFLQAIYPYLSSKRRTQIDDAKCAVTLKLTITEFRDWDVTGGGAR